MYQSVLQQIGLSHGDIMLYTTLLKLGSQPASIVARQVGQNRTTVLAQLKQLAERGFVRTLWRGRSQYFIPEKPDDVLKNLERRKKQTLSAIEQQMKSFSGIMPELLSIAREDLHLPKVTFYEGTDELKRMYTDSLTSQTEILCLSSVEDLWELFGKKYDAWYVAKRAKKHIPLRYIAKDTPLERAETKKNASFLRQSHLISGQLFDISNEINIYDGKVSIITLKTEKIGILIQSQEIYHSMKVIFEVLWRAAR